MSPTMFLSLPTSENIVAKKNILLPGKRKCFITNLETFRTTMFPSLDVIESVIQYYTEQWDILASNDAQTGAQTYPWL